jgi:hypothetical protein
MSLAGNIIKIINSDSRYTINEMSYKAPINSRNDEMSAIRLKNLYNKGWFKLKDYDIEDASAIIELILEKHLLKPIYLIDNKSSIVSKVVAGELDLFSICKYLNNEFALIGVDDLEGKKFDEIPVKLQNRLEDKNVSLIYLDDTTTPEMIQKIIKYR